MMSENYFVDEDFGMELQSLDSQEEGRGQQFHRRGPETIILTMPAEWLDPRQPLPTDKEFHRWISEQLRARRRGQIPPSSRGLRQQSSRGVADDADNMSYGSNGSDNSEGSGFGRVIKEASTNLFGGVLRQRRNQQQSEQVNLLLDDRFTNQQQQSSSRDNGVVGMELSVMS